MTSHYQVAKAFAEGKTKGKGSRMFIDGNIIYSHGYHFPIAKRVRHNGKLLILFNANGYSMSTSQHKSYVRRCLDCEVVEVEACDLRNVLPQYKHNILTITKYKLKSKRARTEHYKSYWNNQISYLKQQNKLLFDLGLNQIAEGL